MSNQTAEDTLLNHIFDYQTGVEIAQAEGITEEDFSLDWNRRLWLAMVAVRGRGQPLDHLFVREELENGGLKGEQAITVLSQASEGATCRGFTAMYAQRLKRDAHQRRIAKTIELANARLGDGEEPDWVRNEMQDELLRVESASVASHDHSMAEIVPAALQALSDQLNGDTSKAGLRTGLDDLDFLTTGLNADELWVAGGMPGRGKTAFALQTALGLAGAGTPVYLVSLEMSKSAIFRRMLRMKFGATTLANPGTKRWLEEVCPYAEDLKSLPLFVNDSSSFEVHDIVAHARLAVERHGARLIIVDYLQLIRAQKGMERREAVAENTNALRALAKDTHVPVLLLSQLRRPLKLNDRPSMIDLKESGDIEAHAHVVLLLYFPVAEDGSFLPEAEIIVGKQREGPTGSVPVCFDGSRGLFLPRYTRNEG